MLLDDMVDLFSSGGVASTSAIFQAVLPDEPDEAVCVYETGGLPTVKTIGGSGFASVAAERPSIEVVSRSSVSYQAARLVAERAFRLLDGLAPRAINGVPYKWAEPRQKPFPVGRDEASRFLVGFNADLILGTTSTS